MEDSVQDDLHDATMKEVDIGTLHGPYSATGGYRTLWIFFSVADHALRLGPYT